MLEASGPVFRPGWPDILPVVPREDAVRLERAQEFDGVGHEPEKVLLAVLLGQDHGHSEQAPEPGEQLAEGPSPLGQPPVTG